jgi:hypothetical protein
MDATTEILETALTPSVKPEKLSFAAYLQQRKKVRVIQGVAN